MSELQDPDGRADELVHALRRLRRLVSQRDRLPRDSRDRFALQDEIDATQQHAWRLAAAWNESAPDERMSRGSERVEREH